MPSDLIKISVVVTCFNNEKSIEKCLNSVRFADEILVLDSFSSDNTLALIKKFTVRLKQQEFKGFWQQKQDAIDFARHDWVLLLDSDEFLSSKAQKIMQQWQRQKPRADAYALPRREWVFWQWSHPWVKRNTFVRLFNKNRASMSHDLVHESVLSEGKIAALGAEIRHFGETSIAVKMSKINRYSTLAAQQKYSRGKRVGRIKLLVYPLWYFFRQYFIRRQIFNGVAGFINAYLNSKYAFLKYAKLYELQKNKN